MEEPFGRLLMPYKNMASYPDGPVGTVGVMLCYRIKYRIGNQYFVGAYVEAEADSNGSYIAYFPAADEVSITVRFKYTYAFRHVGDTTSGTYRLYVRGTDYLHNRTDCFAASMKSATLNASGITVMNGSNGARITSGGVQTTSDGGATWQ
jgi:hypothetical protein